MELWFNVLREVAKPVLKTLVCAGTSSLLETIQNEIKNEQKHQTQNLLKSLGLEGQTVSDFEPWLNQLAALGELSSPREERLLQGHLISSHLAINSQLASQAQEKTGQISEIQKTLDHWPLRLLPTQLIRDSHAGDVIPLRILMRLPQGTLAKFESRDWETEEIERAVAQTLREFLEAHYPLQDPVKPTEFLGGAWNSEDFHGESSLNIIFSRLKSVPTLIIESAFEGDYLNFRLAYWGRQPKNYYYKTLLKLPYKEFLANSAKVRALKWKTVRDQLLLLGKTPAEINRLGGNDAINLAIAEEVATLQSLGINSHALTLSYQLHQKDFEALCQFVGVCHCLVAGWMSELHYGISDPAALNFSNWLPQLTQAIANPKDCHTLLENLVKIYQVMGQGLTSEAPRAFPETTLKLAQSLISLADQSLAREQVRYSLQSWLNLHQLHQLDELENLETMASTLTGGDLNYLATLKTCFLALGGEAEAAKLDNILERCTSQIRQPGNFLLAHTLTSQRGIASFAITPDGQKLVGSSEERTIELWHLDKSSQQFSDTPTFLQHSGEILTFTLSPDGQTLVSSEITKHRSYIKVWHLPTGKLQQTLFGHKQPIRSLAISPWNQRSEGLFLASGSHKIKLWNLETGESCQTLFGHRAWVRSLAISADAQFLFSGSDDRTVRIWQLSTGELLRTLSGHQGCVRLLATTSDGETFVSGSDDGTLNLWHIQTGKLLHTYRGHSKAITAMAITPDNEYLMSSSQDKTVRIWHLSTGKLLETLTCHRETVRSLFISPDGHTLASGSSDKTIKIWQTSSVKMRQFF